MITTPLKAIPDSGKLPVLILKVAEWIDNEPKPRTHIALDLVREEASDEPSYWKALFSLLDPTLPTSVYEWKTYTTNDRSGELLEGLREQLEDEYGLSLHSGLFYQHAVALTVHDAVLAAKIRRFLRTAQ